MSNALDDAVAFLSLLEVSKRLRLREISSLALTELCLRRICSINPQLKAFITVLEKESSDAARDADREIAAGNWRGPLHGVPVAVKDLVDVAGTVTTGASLAFAGDPPATADAPLVHGLRNAGAIILGKTNLHELAYGGTGAISAYGLVPNPWDATRVAGGSSSGSAAAVAAGLCYAAIGTDTAGSIRVPASSCGVVGLKPTFGLVSVEGVLPLSVSFDNAGPQARTSMDALAVLEAIAPNGGWAIWAISETKWSGTRVGVPRTGFLEGMAPEVEQAWNDTLERVRAVGVKLVEVDISADGDLAHFALLAGESYRVHRDRVAVGSPFRELYDPRTLARIEEGAVVTDEQIAHLRAKLAADRAATNEIFTGVDLLLTPTMPILPPSIAELDRPQARTLELLMLRNTFPFDVLGLPTVTVPVALAGGVPIGMQLTAAAHKDGTLLRMSSHFELGLDRGCAVNPIFR
jgi:Asp-tRNA(Asn)/Glu-tRNA(Gln) amidotransferase A subunit family amidase